MEAWTITIRLPPFPIFSFYDWKYNKNSVSLDKILMRYEINFPDVWFSSEKIMFMDLMMKKVFFLKKCVSLWDFVDGKWSKSEQEFWARREIFWSRRECESKLQNFRAHKVLRRQMKNNPAPVKAKFNFEKRDEVSPQRISYLISFRPNTFWHISLRRTTEQKRGKPCW